LDSSLPRTIETWCACEIPDNRLISSLLEKLQIPSDGFWSDHWTLQSPALPRPQPLLGATRVTDLAMNVVLPWLWARALEGDSKSILERLEHRYSTWPPAQDNAVLRLARQRLLGTSNSNLLPGAAAQQGLIQLVRDFCDHSNAVCEACKLPDLVRKWKSP
jgi:hypothetical protein